MKLRTQSGKWPVASGMKMRRTRLGISCHPSPVTRHAAFTLIELMLVLALLVIITSLAAPAMANFVRGRALDSEARRLVALMHAGQSRAVSEGLPMMLWVDEKNGAYGLGSPAATQRTSRATRRRKIWQWIRRCKSRCRISVCGAPTTFNNLPAIRFLPDGSVDENSPQTLQLTDAPAFRAGSLNSDHSGYEIRDTKRE